MWSITFLIIIVLDLNDNLKTFQLRRLLSTYLCTYFVINIKIIKVLMRTCLYIIGNNSTWAGCICFLYNGVCSLCNILFYLFQQCRPTGRRRTSMACSMIPVSFNYDYYYRPLNWSSLSVLISQFFTNLIFLKRHLFIYYPSSVLPLVSRIRKSNYNAS